MKQIPKRTALSVGPMGPDAFTPRAPHHSRASRHRSAPKRTRTVAAAILGLVGLGSCVPPGDGVVPPRGVLYFPVGMATDAAKTHLFVIGSDFDLQYNHGTIHSLSLARLRELAGRPCKSDADCRATDPDSQCDTTPTEQNELHPSFLCVPSSGEHALDPCRGIGFKSTSLRATSPGLCAPIDIEKPADGRGTLIRDWVQIPAFATDAILLERPKDASTGPEERLFVPSRGDSSLHWLDIDSGKMTCGQDENLLCSDQFRTQDNPDVIPNPDTGEILKAPADPFSVTASRDGRLLAVTHQTDRAVSAYVNDWAAGATLVSVARSTLGSPVGIAALPDAFTADNPISRTGFLMTFRDLAEVRMLRFFPSPSGNPSSPGVLRDAGRVPIRLNTPGLHSRGILIDSTESEEASDACPEADLPCLLKARALPRKIYIANRSPNSLLIGRTEPSRITAESPDLPVLFDSIPLVEGPAELFFGQVMTPSGKAEPRLFAVCFDAAMIFVFNADTGELDSQIITGRGPQAIAFDNFDSETGEVHPLLYVGHFTDSYVGVISLDQRYPTTYGATLATIGYPVPPRASK